MTVCRVVYMYLSAVMHFCLVGRGLRSSPLSFLPFDTVISLNPSLLACIQAPCLNLKNYVCR